MSILTRILSDYLRLLASLHCLRGEHIFFLLKASPHNSSRVDFVIYLRLCGGSKRIFMIVPWVEKNIYNCTLVGQKLTIIRWVK